MNEKSKSKLSILREKNNYNTEKELNKFYKHIKYNNKIVNFKKQFKKNQSLENKINLEKILKSKKNKIHKNKIARLVSRMDLKLKK